MHTNFLMIEASWDCLNIKYIHSAKLVRNSLIMYVANTETLEDDWLNYIPKNFLRDYLLISLAPSLLTQILGQKNLVSHSQFIYQIEITDPSILHLAHLLRTEIEAPRILSQEFVFAIVTAMITAQRLPITSFST
jgi:hypothetical protein